MNPRGVASHFGCNTSILDAAIIDCIELSLYNFEVQSKLSDAFYQVAVVSYSSVLLIAVLANVLMLYSVLSTWRERKVLNHRCFYLSLIVCDLLVALILLPTTCYAQIDSRWFLGKFSCKAVHGLSVCLMCSSVLSLTGVSWLRSLGAGRPAVNWFDRRRSLGRELAAIGVIWLLSGLMSLPAAHVSEIQQQYDWLSALLNQTEPINWPVCTENWGQLDWGQPDGNDTSSSVVFRFSASFWYGVAVLCLAFLLPLLSLGIAYFRICRVIYMSNRMLTAHRRCQEMVTTGYRAPDTTMVRLSSMQQQQQQHHHCHHVGNKQPHHHFQHEHQQHQTPSLPASTCNAINQRRRLAASRRMFLLGVALVLVFAITWLPIQCLQLIRACTNPELWKTELAHKLAFAFHFLALANCLVNPCFLVATHSPYRRRLLRLLRNCQQLRRRHGCCFLCLYCRASWHCGFRRRLRVLFRRNGDQVELNEIS